MIEIKIADKSNLTELMDVRLEMLRIVNSMGDEEQFSDELVECSRNYFLNGDQTTVLAWDEGKVIGCASMSYIWIMPTYSHPTGKRGHLMNVYTNKNYRRQGIAAKMVTMLIDEAKARGATEVSLDATEAGKPLYKSLGFTENTAGMTLKL
ncbi:MAG: GNAT family N-acetyltransferase [Treponema sp.]|nr:GNAT family N-acetyltransferase [Treponema sp.]